MARYLLLLNRSSGGNERGLDADEVSRQVEEIFREQGHEIRSVQFASGAIESSLKEAVASSPDGIIVAGGDGSQSQYIHVWGQSTPDGGSTRSVTKLIQE